MGYTGPIETDFSVNYVVGYHHGSWLTKKKLHALYNEILSPLRNSSELQNLRFDNMFIEFYMNPHLFQAMSGMPFNRAYFEKAKREGIPINVMDVSTTEKGREPFGRRELWGRYLSMAGALFVVGSPAIAKASSKASERFSGKPLSRRQFLKVAGGTAAAGTGLFLGMQNVYPWLQAVALAVPGKKSEQNVFFSWFDRTQTIASNATIEGRNAIWTEKSEAVSRRELERKGRKPVNLIICDSAHLPGVVRNLRDAKRRRKNLHKFLVEQKGNYMRPFDEVLRFDPKTGKITEKMKIRIEEAALDYPGTAQRRKSVPRKRLRTARK